MTDLKSPRLIYLKGFFFLVGAFMSAGLLIADQPTLKVMLLLAICVWCSCRFYYFAFYVIQHYVDDEFQFAGLFDFAKYFFSKKR